MRLTSHRSQIAPTNNQFSMLSTNVRKGRFLHSVDTAMRHGPLRDARPPTYAFLDVGAGDGAPQGQLAGAN